MLKKISRNANQKYLALHLEGVGIGNEIFKEIDCQIIDIDKYHYRWTDGKIKEIKHGLDDKDAKAEDAKALTQLHKIVYYENHFTTSFSVPLLMK